MWQGKREGGTERRESTREIKPHSELVGVGFSFPQGVLAALDYYLAT